MNIQAAASPERDHVKLGFFNAAAPTDPDSWFEGTGKKMRHVKVRTAGDIRADVFRAWVQEAVRVVAAG